MSDPPSPDPEHSLPDGIPAPPPPRPPDLKVPDKAEPTYGNTDQLKKTRERNHPTDPYEALKKKRGCGGCCGCLGGSLLVIVLLFISLVGTVAYFGPGRYITEGYKVVTLTEPETIITTAPGEPTIYLGQLVTYNVPVTNFPVAIVAKEIIVSGDFLKEVSLTGAKVTGLANTRFAEDLEVVAAEFHDKGIILKGNLNGRVMKNLN